MINKIIAGGQTGTERAALDVAIELGIPYGGWIPKGRKTEDGRLPEKYQLKEMPTESYLKHTEKYGLRFKSSELLKDCRFITKNSSLHVDNASAVIIKGLWKRLRKTHALRVVKKKGER